MKIAIHCHPYFIYLDERDLKSLNNIQLFNYMEYNNNYLEYDMNLRLIYQFI